MKMWKIMITLMMATAMCAGNALATPARLNSITAAVKYPVRVAVDSQGSLYVAEASENKIVKYDAAGNYVAAISVSYPLSVAVDASGNIYAGCMVSSKKQGLKNVVSIFAPDFTKIGSLGAGEGEFTFPVDITIDANGKIYVVDKDVHTVSVYDPSTRAKVLSFGGFGNANGQLTRPTSVAVNDITGEVFVADAPQVTTVNGLTNGARISVFDKSGVFRRSFGSFGVGLGQMTSPEDIAIDQAGQLYVVDAYQGAALTMNPADGSSVGAGALYDAAAPMYNPSGIAMTTNGLVYIASKKGAGAGLGSQDRIDVYALDGYVTMSTIPSSLSYSITQGESSTQDIRITNNGSGTLNWTAVADQPWIVLAQPSGSIPGSAQTPPVPGSALLSVGINGALTLGTHTGNVTVDSGFGQKNTIPLTVTVIPAPTLTVSNQTIALETKARQDPAPVTVTIGIDSLLSPMSWMASSDANWLNLSLSSGKVSPASPSASIQINVTSSGVAVGTSTGHITVTSKDLAPANATRVITVTLKVTSAGRIVVTTDREDAKFTISGPATYSCAGVGCKNWSTDGAPAGDYTVTFDAITGYKKPAAQKKTLAENGEVTFNAAYGASFENMAARKRIVASKGPAETNDSLLKFYKGNGDLAAADFLALTTNYGANVAIGDVDGDGSAEIIVGAGAGPTNAATIRIYHADRSFFLEFVALGTLHGARIAAADLNGDGRAEIIVSPAGGSENTGTVTVYTYDAISGKMVPTGIELAAFSYPYGANIAVADLDGNGKPYLLTAPGFGKQNTASVKVWKVDTSPEIGKWSAALVKEHALTGSYGATVAAADIDGDGADEIIAGTGGVSNGDASMVTIIKANGSQSSFKAFERYSVNVAAADLDGDGKAEILVAAGNGTKDQGNSPAAGTISTGLSKMDTRRDGQDKQAAFGGTDSEVGTVRILNGAGAVKFVIRPFVENVKEGVIITVGDLAQ